MVAVCRKQQTTPRNSSLSVAHVPRLASHPDENSASPAMIPVQAVLGCITRHRVDTGPHICEIHGTTPHDVPRSNWAMRSSPDLHVLFTLEVPPAHERAHVSAKLREPERRGGCLADDFVIAPGSNFTECISNIDLSTCPTKATPLQAR